MKNIFFIIFVLLFQNLFSKPVTDMEKLTATCKVWGFLKYYHPKVASGTYNWDRQLIDILPKIEMVKTKEEFSTILENWIDSLGEVKEIASITTSKNNEYFDKNFDLNWFTDDNVFSENLSNKLKFIENNRFQGEQYYIQTHNGGNVFVKNENFSALNFNDKSSRTLVLFMYWNLIEYFFPYKYVMDQKWDKTLKDVLPFFVGAKNPDDFYREMQKLTVKLNDSHGVFYLYPKRKLNFFPAKCKIIDEKMVVSEILADSLAKADGIRIGDVITKINNKTIREIILESKDLIYGSNQEVILNNIAKYALSGVSDSVEIEFLKGEKYITKIFAWYNYHDSHRNEFQKNIKKERFKIIDDNIGFVDMGTLKVNNVPAMIEKLKFTKAIIFDMRNYPNGTFEEISFFLNSQKKEFAIYTVPDLSYPGKFKWIKGSDCGSENKSNYKGKIILLLNEESMSQAEWTAMCFQTADNTTIIGSQTAGADGNVTEFDLVKAFFTRFSGLGVYYPDKRETQRIGIIPDIEVKPTIEGIQKGKDEILDRALLFIKTGK